ncbi:MAG: LamG domain-containing protein, partial [Flavobacteriaceae bacterium]
GAIDSGQSAVFNGSSSKIVLTGIKTNGSPLTVTDFSVSMWINLADVTSNQILIGNISGDTYQIGWSLSILSGTIRLLTDSTGTIPWQMYKIYNSTLSTNTWYHIILVSDGTANKLYINGTEITSVTYNIGSQSQLYSNSNNLELSLGGSSSYVNGKIDQVRIYSSALSASDVEALVSETNVPTANLVAHYKLDGDATDETTNYDGTWGGTEAYSDPAEFPNVAYNGTPTNVNFLGMAFAPDLVWIKSRDNAREHILCDSVRGVNKELSSDNNYFEESRGVNSFDTNGFTLDGLSANYNSNNESYVAWNWKAGGAAVLNEEGDIDSQVSANTDAGFSIATWSGDNTASNIGHGLGGIPELMIIKNRTGTNSWIVGVPDVLGTGYLILNDSGQASTSNVFGQVPDSTKYYFNTAAGGNGHLSTGNYVGYFFRSITEYQKVGSYDGGTLSSSNIENVGFRPRFVLLKPYQSPNNWVIYDTVRDATNPHSNILYPNLSDQEAISSNDNYNLYITDEGFYFNNTVGYLNNTTSGDVIYLAIA